MNWSTTATLVVTVAVAFGGYFATYLWNLRIAQRKDRLERVNRQLSELYGPLLALVTAGTRAFQVWRSSEFTLQSWDEASDADKAEWQLWMTHVFMPLNRRMMDVITTHADLLVGSDLPAPLLDLAAHVWEYEALLAKWDNRDFSRMVPEILFPRDALSAYVSETFLDLKREQASLLTAR
jgi:hypothetical protein